MNILRVLIILGIVVAHGVSGEMNRFISTTGIAGRYLAWRRSGGLRSDCKSLLYFTGWHIYASDWGCCGNYGGCCLYAHLACHLHDAACSPCCSGGPWLCGPYCNNDETTYSGR